MIQSSIARRYARALLELAPDRTQLQAWSAQLLALGTTFAGSAELQDVVVNPVYAKEQRRAIVLRLAASLTLDPALQNLIQLLADRNRLRFLPAIADAFAALADEKMGRLRATLLSAVPLESAVAHTIQARLAQLTRREVVVSPRVDPAILGGVVAQVGDVLYDGSVRTQLEALRRTLKQ